jgi:thioredoxin-related protein
VFTTSDFPAENPRTQTRNYSYTQQLPHIRKKMRIRFNIICFLFISSYLFGQSKKDCKQLLKKEITSATFSENIDEYLLDIQTLIKCEFEEIDLQIFMGPKGNMSFIAGQLVQFAGESTKNEVYTFENLKETLQSIKNNPEYSNVVKKVQAQNTLLKKNALGENWEVDKQLLKNMGLAGIELDDFNSIIKENENKPYSEIFIVYSDTLNARTERQISENQKKIKELKKQNPESVEWVKGLLSYDNYELGLKKSKELNKPILLYFNGYAVVNARKIEEYVLSEFEIQDYINKNLVFVSLLVDDKTKLEGNQKFYSDFLDKEIKTIGQKNMELQMSKYKANSQPLFILLDLEGNEISRIGYTRDINEFSDFLK